MEPLNTEIHLMAKSGILNQHILSSLPNVTKCYGLDAVREARKRVPIVLRVADLAGLFPLLGLGLALAGFVFVIEKILLRNI